MNLIVIDFLFHVFPSNMDKPQNTSSHHLRGTATKLMNLNQSCNIVKSNSSSRIEGSCNKLKDEKKPQELPKLPLHVSKPPTTTKQNSTGKLTQKIVRSRKRKRKQFFGWDRTKSLKSFLPNVLELVPSLLAWISNNLHPYLEKDLQFLGPFLHFMLKAPHFLKSKSREEKQRQAKEFLDWAGGLLKNMWTAAGEWFNLRCYLR